MEQPGRSPRREACGDVGAGLFLSLFQGVNYHMQISKAIVLYSKIHIFYIYANQLCDSGLSMLIGFNLFGGHLVSMFPHSVVTQRQIQLDGWKHSWGGGRSPSHPGISGPPEPPSPF